MGVAAALVVMEKRALFRIIFLDQKKKIYSTFACGSICWLRKLSLCCCKVILYLNLQNGRGFCNIIAT